MKYLLEELQAQERGAPSVYALSALQRAYSCRCGRAVFFRNSQCLTCFSQLGYEPLLGRIFALDPGPEPNTWTIAGPLAPEDQRKLYWRCANLNSPAWCNWLVEVDVKGRNHQGFCIACRLNRTVPSWTNSEDASLWGKIENAKRYVVSGLIALGLPVQSRLSEDPESGLAFDFLRTPPGGPRILTGHTNGLITLNIEEADDVRREQMRTSMREPYRTLVGHIRHEVGHYFWERLIAPSKWLTEFRLLFGDERVDYASALQRNYRDGPSQNWHKNFVSAYASVHPWEDWAETWAHYLHMVDTLGTALSFGIRPEAISLPLDHFGPEALCPSEQDAERFLSFLNAWLKLTAVMNELCRSMGQPDFYPFSLPAAAVRKLHFVHLTVCRVGQRV
jgi:hypothetical protein